ncbi:hypothetical protein ISF_02428 [Cordyceps fumosorosea ARSEF 2679]|uniref:Uncharacterized protein n=1 Tax=Cordyceps fumosorosea (strain ARSEF 2679) TaxID=1081104 RepID=A0A162LGZ3_CORFA|nr:hypothetical protein ISF_02428 [Cordyceps fumosorosea ARSEF 2679]OAA70454.1 hypothetical protein ISF_02428 [Cordyceps fumosorosea ARSEF 2679]
MEAAAKTVELLTQRTLPDTPYYLSNHPDWRYRPRPDDHLRPEEWHSTRLQYSTLLAEADRGVLLTRPDYDMREEPPKPALRDVTQLSKAGGEKKKLSLSDYKNKKTAATSPPEPSIPRREAERAGAPSSKPLAGSGVRPSSDVRAIGDSRRPPDARPTDARKDRPRDSSDGNSRNKEYAADTSLPVKPPLKNYPLPPRPPSPGGKKRVADNDDDLRPQKRSRPENSRPNDDRALHRDDPVRRRDSSLVGASHRDSPLLNGKSSLQSGSALAKGASPAGRSRGDINGTQPGAMNRSTHKQESPKKSVVPPLLSPLHLGPGFDEPPPPKNDRRKADDTPLRSKKPENLAEEKKRKPAVTLPPLLSPTLPPHIEAALLRRQQGSPEADERPRQKRDPVPKHKKSPSADDSLDEAPAKPRRLIVKLRIPAGLPRKMFRRIMVQSATALSRDKERSTDDDRQHARKRPIATTEPDSLAMKKSRPSDAAGRGPTTPPRKNQTAMSRANSNNSTAHTPGELMGRTPSSTGASDKRPNGVAPSKPDADSLREKETRLRHLGKRLKHSAESAFNKGKHSSTALNSKDSRPRSNSEEFTNSSTKLGLVLAVESSLCFMQMFQALEALTVMQGKKPNGKNWPTVIPVLRFFLSNLQRPEGYRPVQALLLLLEVFAADEIIKATLAMDVGPETSQTLFVTGRQRGAALAQVREVYAHVDNPRLRADVAPWSSLDEFTETAMRVLRRWCADEDVDWIPELSPRDYGR